MADGRSLGIKFYVHLQFCLVNQFVNTKYLDYDP